MYGFPIIKFCNPGVHYDTPCTSRIQQLAKKLKLCSVHAAHALTGNRTAEHPLSPGGRQRPRNGVFAKTRCSRGLRLDSTDHHHPLLLLLGAALCLDESSPSHFILSQSLHFLPSFPRISSFFFHCAFPGFLRPTSPSLTLRIPVQCIFFSYSLWFAECVVNPGPFSLLSRAPLLRL